MARAFDKRTLALLAAILAVLAIFMLDLFTPPLFAAWTLYVPVVFALFWWARKRDIYITAVVCTALICLGFFLAPAEQRMNYSLTNRLLEIAIILALAVGMGRRIDARRTLLRQHSNFKRLLDERNSALEEIMTQQRRTEEEKKALAEQLATAERNIRCSPWLTSSEEPAAAAPVI
jgi:uncharacterized membrane protein YccC